MGALLIGGVIVFILIAAAGMYVLSRRSHRPADDVQPPESSNERKLETLENMHIRGDMKTSQYETMQEALDPKTTQEDEELKEAQ
jgi:hypothetical protein